MDNVLNITQTDGIVTITIERPKALNAINKGVMTGLNEWFSQGYQSVKGLKGVILTGSGEKAFAAGADIKEFTGLTAEAGAAMSKYGQDTYFLIENFHVPVVAAVNGFALGGGCELTMACHIRIASTNAKFGQPEVNLGLVPGYGGTQRLPQIIGKGRAMELLLTADMIDAEKALQYGLVTHVVELDQLIEKATKIINKIAMKGPISIEKTIDIVNDFYRDSVDGYATEYNAFGELLTGDECHEGVNAFVEKRKADFKRK